MSDGSKPNARDPWRWYLPHRAIILLGVVLIFIALVGATLGVVNSARAEELNSRLTDRYLVLLPPVRQIRASESAFQVLAEEAFANTTAAPSVVTGAVSDSNAINKAYLTLQHLLALPGNATLDPHLATLMATYVAAQSSLGAFLAGEPQTATTTRLAAVEKSAAAALDANLGSLQSTIDDRLDTTADQAQAASNSARVDLLWSIAIGLACSVTVIAVLGRHALRVEREQSRHEAVQSDLAHRIEFEATLQTALEMSKAEASVFDVVAEVSAWLPRACGPSCSWPIPARPTSGRCSSAPRKPMTPGAASCPPTTARPHRGRGPWCSPRAPRSTLVPTSGAGGAPRCASR